MHHFKIVLTSLVLLAGCQSQITGNEGNLVFSYNADDNLIDFNKPIAVGAKLELRVTDSETRQSVTIDEASTEDTGVLDVDSFAGDRMILVGMGDGNTTINVDATGPDGVLSDSVNMRSTTPTELEIWHSCYADKTSAGLYTSGAKDVLLPYEMKNGRTAVIGYGILPWMQTPDVLTVDQASRDQAYVHVGLPDTPQTVELASIFDDSTLSVEIIDPGRIDGTELNTVSAVQRVIAEETHLFHFYPTVGEQRVCQSRVEMQVENKSEEICELRVIPDNKDTRFINEFNWVSLKGLAQGACVFDVIYPDGNDGSGARQEVTIDVAAFADP